MKKIYISGIFLFCTIMFAGSVSWYIVVNPTNGIPEAVWSAKGDSDSSYEIRYSYLDGIEWAPSNVLTSDSIDDCDPKFAFDRSGNKKVAWWSKENYDRIKFSSRASSGGSWSTPEAVSSSTENCRFPSIVVHNSTAYLSYERINSSGGRSVLAASEDSATPWPENHITLTQRTANLETRIYSVNSHLWVDWIDSVSYLGYSEYVSGSWESPQYESYSGETDIENGRQRIRQTIIEN